jgi:hypothetical protein
VSNIDHPGYLGSFMMTFWPSGFSRAGLVYNFSIHSGDGSHREILGCTDLLNDYAALAFGNDVIRDMLRHNADQHTGWMMDITMGERAVCTVVFPLPSQGRMRA